MNIYLLYELVVNELFHVDMNKLAGQTYQLQVM